MTYIQHTAGYRQTKRYNHDWFIIVGQFALKIHKKTFCQCCLQFSGKTQGLTNSWSQPRWLNSHVTKLISRDCDIYWINTTHANTKLLCLVNLAVTEISAEKNLLCILVMPCDRLTGAQLTEDAVCVKHFLQSVVKSKTYIYIPYISYSILVDVYPLQNNIFTVVKKKKVCSQLLTHKRGSTCL